MKLNNLEYGINGDVNKYIFKLGFLDGVYGIVICAIVDTPS